MSSGDPSNRGAGSSRRASTGRGSSAPPAGETRVPPPRLPGAPGGQSRAPPAPQNPARPPNPAFRPPQPIRHATGSERTTSRVPAPNIQEMMTSAASSAASPAASPAADPSQSKGKEREPLLNPQGGSLVLESVADTIAPPTSKGRQSKRVQSSGQPLEVVYPDLFLPIERASVYQVTNKDPYIGYNWREDEGMTAEQENKARTLIDTHMRRVTFTFTNRNFTCRLVKDLFADVDTRSVTFCRLRLYANDVYNNIKHEFLWNCIMGIVVSWERDFGQTHFKVDVHEWEQNATTKEEVKAWVFGKIDEGVFNQACRPFKNVIEYADNFVDREDFPFYYLKCFLATFIIGIGKIYCYEIRYPENTGADGYLKNWKPTLKEWVPNKSGRDSMNQLFDRFGSSQNFRDINLDTFNWKRTEESSTRTLRGSKRTAEELLDRWLVADPPPAPRKSPRRERVEVEVEVDEDEDGDNDENPFSSPIRPNLGKHNPLRRNLEIRSSPAQSRENTRSPSQGPSTQALRNPKTRTTQPDTPTMSGRKSQSATAGSSRQVSGASHTSGSRHASGGEASGSRQVSGEASGSRTASGSRQVSGGGESSGSRQVSGSRQTSGASHASGNRQASGEASGSRTASGSRQVSGGEGARTASGSRQVSGGEGARTASGSRQVSGDNEASGSGEVTRRRSTRNRKAPSRVMEGAYDAYTDDDDDLEDINTHASMLRETPIDNNNDDDDPTKYYTEILARYRAGYD
ncbi:hypothetical protein G7054_g7827 [Neopestalotiopsis clavispora]|nr:hypothetical protein G7054_g7827 [Neopestalotiopsis clavispora]